MKRKITSIKSSQQIVSDSYIHEDCWESIFKFMVNDDSCCLNSLSLVSKRFLSITNSLLFSLNVRPSTVPFLKRLLKRFTNLTSIELGHCIDIDNILHLISRFQLKKLTYLTIHGNHSKRTFPTNGLRAFSQNITTLTSLTCYSMFLDNNDVDLLLIADCFPLLKELNLINPLINYRSSFINGMRFLLSEHQFVINQTDFINGLHSLLSKCRCIQHLNLNQTYFLNDQHVAELSLFHGDLVSISLNDCSRLTESALFSLIRNCPSLSEINMENTAIGKESVENSSVYPQLKSLYLGRNAWLRDEKIIMLASFFPNLQLLDLNNCKYISNNICQVLRRYCKITHLNLSNTKVGDETLYAISKNCHGLLKLLLKNCKKVTKKGVKHVVKNCTQLREIYLDDLHLSDKNRKFFLRHGCLLC